MKFLTASMRHGLLPLHHRLRREGHDTEALVWRPRYEKAWDGSVRKLARHSDGTLHAGVLEDAVKAANLRDLIVLTDVRRVAELFHTAPYLYRVLEGQTIPRDRVLLGGWFDGESIQAPHLLIADLGTWTGGGGPAVLGGLTLVRLSGEVPPFAAGPAQAAGAILKSAGFRGLFHFDVEEQATTGELKLRGLSAGWPWLHTQAFVAELESLSSILATSALPKLTRRFVTAIPISVPPWPSEKQSDIASVEIKGLTPQQQGAVMWHDIAIDQKARKLRTAGLDGMLGVALGASDSTPALARARALELCARLEVPELQFRADTGGLVDSALSTFEDRWGFSAL